MFKKGHRTRATGGFMKRDPTTPAPAGAAASTPADADLPCPHCGYNLRMLPEPRCPECGLQSDWQTLAAIHAQTPAALLFEHHWRRRPVASLFGTAALAMVPPLLWRRVRSEHASHVGPLLALAFLVGVGSTALLAAVFYALLRTFLSTFPIGFEDALAYAAHDLATLVVLGAAIWVTVRLLSRRKDGANARSAHLLRVCVLAWLALVLWKQGVMILLWGSAVAYFHVTGCEPAWSGITHTEWTSAPAEIISIGMFAWSLCLGLSVKPRPRRGVAIGLLALAVVFSVAVVVVACSAVAFGTFSNPCVWTIGSSWPATAVLLLWIVTKVLLL
jgi:hypothetical protein